MTKVKSKSLSLAMPQSASIISSALTSPSELDSRTASPRFAQHGSLQHDVTQDGTSATIDTSLRLDEIRDSEASAITSLPPVPSSPKNVPKHGQSRSLFGNLKAAKSSNKVNNLETTIRQVSEDLPRDDMNVRGAGLYSLGKGPGSTPDLSLSTLNTGSLDISGCESRTLLW